jgi:D-alanyl-D-alanine endopeptidase (penicillin-binding protein 7)
MVIVLLDSLGKYTRLGDAQRVKHWLETGESLPPPTAKAAVAKAKSRPVKGTFAPKLASTSKARKS